MAEEKNSNVFDVLEAKLEELKKDRGCDTSSMSTLCLALHLYLRTALIAELTKNIHFYPDLVSCKIEMMSGFMLIAQRCPSTVGQAYKEIGHA
jgi:hypothetical protein